MNFIYTILDILITIIMLFDTLGMVYQFRKGQIIQANEYKRICFSWILFLAMCSLLSCESKGLLGKIIRFIILDLKLFVTIPLFNGTMKIYKFLIEDENAEHYFKKIVEKIKKLMHKEEAKPSCSERPINNIVSETSKPETTSTGCDS